MTNNFIDLNGIKVDKKSLSKKHQLIANLAGLHYTTVNKVLNHSRESFLPETIDKIRDAIIQYNFDSIVVTDSSKISNILLKKLAV